MPGSRISDSLRFDSPGLCHILDAARHQRSPAGLMACAGAAAVVAMEIFVEENQVFPARIIGEAEFVAMTRTTASGIG